MLASLIALSVIGGYAGAPQDDSSIGRATPERAESTGSAATSHVLAKVPHHFPDQFWLASNADGSPAAASARQDFVELFKPDAGWPTAGNRVQAVVFRVAFLDALSDDQLQTVIRGARARALSLGIDTSMLVATARCGRGVPGYEQNGMLEHVVDRIKASGGQIEIVSLHSPVWFAHRLSDPTHCHSSIADVAAHMRSGTRLFNTDGGGPTTFVDTELADDRASSGELHDVLKFAEEFQRSTGFIINGIHVAATGLGLNREHLREWQRDVAATDADFGIVFGRSITDESDRQWAERALRDIRDALAVVVPGPVVFVLQADGNQHRPTLPDTDLSTLTSIVKRVPTRVVEY